MNPIQAIATLRKFANYLAGIFPFLVVLGDKLYALIFAAAKYIGNLPLIKPLVDRAGQSSVAQSIWKFFERFYWRDYAKDRMELGNAPAETMPVLRAIIQMCVILTLVIPLSQLQICPITVETSSGYKHAMESWSIVLWILCLPTAWASLVIGSAVCNRVVFTFTAIGALYFMSNCVLFLPRSFTNGLLTLAILFALIFCEHSLATESRAARVMRWLCAAMVGAAAGFQFMILTPLRPYLGTLLPWPGPVISIGLGSVTGVCAGVACVAIASRLRAKLNVSIATSMLLVSLTLMAFLASAAWRGGLASLGGAIISSLDASNSLLWPILYFVGVGIIHKLMGSSKVVAASVKGLFPDILLTPALVLLLLAASICALSEDIITYLTCQTSEIGQKAFIAFLPVFKTAQFFIWKDPLLTIATQWMKWVLLFDVAIVCVLAWQRRLTSAALSRLFFITCLLALLFWEYIFQMSSFSRGPIHSVFLIWLFAVWLLWLMHTIGWKLSLKTSALWPSKGRLALYGGIVAMLILQVNARAMCSDYKIVNEIFLTMFCGAINVGLPYYLLLWANKRIKESTPPVGVLLGAYSAGAIVSMCFNALDKCFTNIGFTQVVARQLQNIQATGNLSLDVPIAPLWLFAKGAIFVGMLALVRLATEKIADRAAPEKIADVTAAEKSVDEAAPVIATEKAAASGSAFAKLRHHWILYVSLAFASGVVSFSYALVDLPLPNEVRVALAPLRQEVLFSGNVFHYYLAYWISALIFALAAIKTDKLEKLIVLSFTAILAGGAVLAGYELFEVFLRASGMFVAALAGFGALLFVLILLTLRALDSSGEHESETEVHPTVRSPDALLDFVAMGVLAILSFVVFTLSCFFSPEFKVFSRQEIPALEHSVVMATDWKFKKTTPAKAPYPAISSYVREKQGAMAEIQMMTLDSSPAGVMSLMQKWIKYLQLKVTKLESWERHSQGAYAFEFTLPNPSGLNLYAVSCFVPRNQNRTEVFTLITDAASFDQGKWELAELVRNLQR